MTLQRKLALLSALATAVFLSASPSSYAQNASNGSADELTAVFACRNETDPQIRLACYDAAVGRFEEAQAQGEIVTITKQQVEEVERDSFGFSLPSIPKLGSLFGSGKSKSSHSDAQKENDLTSPVETTKTAERPKPPTRINPEPIKREEIKEIETAIIRTQTFSYKKTRFFLENGQVWEQITSRDVRVPKTRNGVAPKAVIQKASLGSFMLRVNGKGSAVRVKRVR